jgi:hypothetical protein
MLWSHVPLAGQPEMPALGLGKTLTSAGYRNHLCNPLYFDPDREYPPPMRVGFDGAVSSAPNASFTKAVPDPYRDVLSPVPSRLPRASEQSRGRRRAGSAFPATARSAPITTDSRAPGRPPSRSAVTSRPSSRPGAMRPTSGRTRRRQVPPISSWCRSRTPATQHSSSVSRIGTRTIARDFWQ